MGRELGSNRKVGQSGNVRQDEVSVLLGGKANKRENWEDK